VRRDFHGQDCDERRHAFYRPGRPVPDRLTAANEAMCQKYAKVAIGLTAVDRRGKMMPF
jgi:hypothetical protein